MVVDKLTHTTKKNPKSPFPKGTLPSQFAEYNIYDDIEDEREGQVCFDWQNEIAICIRHDPHNPVYDQTFKEFIKYRDLGYRDDIKMKRCYCRVESNIANWMTQVAARHEMHANRYVSTCLELGLILLHHRYHEAYSIVSAVESNAFSSISDTNSFHKMGQLKKQTIVLNTCSRTNKLYGPGIPEGVEGAISSTADLLHCNKNDMAVLCLCIGIQKDSEETPMPAPYMVAVDNIVNDFERELGELVERSRTVNQNIVPTDQ